MSPRVSLQWPNAWRFPRVSGDEPPATSGFAHIPHSFPRVSGDEPDLEEMIIPSHEFSPRERG